MGLYVDGQACDVALTMHAVRQTSEVVLRATGTNAQSQVCEQTSMPTMCLAGRQLDSPRGDVRSEQAWRMRTTTSTS